jgi:hypothetical protein
MQETPPGLTINLVVDVDLNLADTDMIAVYIREVGIFNDDVHVHH